MNVIYLYLFQCVSMCVYVHVCAYVCLFVKYERNHRFAILLCFQAMLLHFTLFINCKYFNLTVAALLTCAYHTLVHMGVTVCIVSLYKSGAQNVIVSCLT